jgi:hypothetical protein
LEGPTTNNTLQKGLLPESPKRLAVKQAKSWPTTNKTLGITNQMAQQGPRYNIP